MTTDFKIFIVFLFLIQEQPTFLVTIIFFISNDIWINADAELKVPQNFVHFIVLLHFATILVDMWQEV